MNQLEGGSSGSLQAHMDDVTCVRFSPDGKMIASCGKDGLLKVHEVDGGEVFSCDAGEPLRSVLGLFFFFAPFSLFFLHFSPLLEQQCSESDHSNNRSIVMIAIIVIIDVC